MMQEVDSGALTQLQWGHGMMALCAALYLVWWILFFRPDAGKVTGALYWFGVGCIVLAAIAGVAGAIVIVIGAKGIGGDTSLSGWLFLAGAVVAYGLLAWVTLHFWNRSITTELLLFVAWATIEIYAVCSLGAAGVLGNVALACFIAAILAVFVLSLVCYMLYYHLSAMPSFIDGSIPLAAVGIFSLILPFLLRL